MSEFTKGVFTVQGSGRVSADFIYDGGGYQWGELAIFSLGGMEAYPIGSYEFAKEASRRALSNSEQGYVLLSDRTEKARFSKVLPWERDFNTGEYSEPRLVTLTPGAQYGLMLLPNNSINELYTQRSVFDNLSRAPIYSIPQLNPGANIDQFIDNRNFYTDIVNIDGRNLYGFEDVRVDRGRSDKDYNDIVVELEGVTTDLPTFDQIGNRSRDFYSGDFQTQIEAHTATNTPSYGEISSSTGRVSVDLLYDGGGYRNASVGIFSLQNLNYANMAEADFVSQAISRSLSNTTQGYVLVQDPSQGARYSSRPSWEGNFNDGLYTGTKNLTLAPNTNYGLVFIPDGLLSEYNGSHLTNPGLATKRPYFSMPYANLNSEIHMVDVLTNGGVLVGLEDRPLQNSDRDYNDFIIRFQGIRSDIPDLSENADLLRHNWQATGVGQEILRSTNTFLDNPIQPVFI